MMKTKNNSYIGIFDSGVGGLTLLPALKSLLPNEKFLYISDDAFAPYGKKDKNEIISLNTLNKEGLEPIVNGLIKKHDTNFKGVGQPIRVALTGSKFGPGLYDIVISLGKEEIEKRLSNKIIT